jgi:hypothetical protein
MNLSFRAVRGAVIAAFASLALASCVSAPDTPAAPTVDLTGVPASIDPATGATVGATTTVDPTLTIDGVEFKLGDRTVCTDTSAPYSCEILPTGAEVGSQSVQAILTDSNDQVASDTAKYGPARLAGAEAPAYEDNETSFAELVGRVRRTVAYLETLPKAAFEGAEDRTVTWQARGKSRSMQAMPYLFNHVLPNIYFHVTTAYAILRHNGVELGKADYLGPM